MFFFPIIYFLGWVIISGLITIFPFFQSEKSLYGTIITFFIFLLFLPYWSKYRWRKNLYLTLIGMKLSNKESLYNLIFEVLKALLIIVFISLCLYVGGFAKLSIDIDKFIIINSLFLGILVGLAEELVFRVWLHQELCLYFITKKSNYLQAIIFAALHLRTDTTLINNLQIFIGLFLLGIYLNQWRNYKNSTFLLPVFFHASLVGFWFFINNSILSIQHNVPNLLFGPGESNNLNPVGGLIGICLLIILNFYRKPNYFNNSSLK